MLTKPFILSYWTKENSGGWKRVTEILSTTPDSSVFQIELLPNGIQPTIYISGVNVSRPKKSKKTNSWKPKQYGRSS